MQDTFLRLCQADPDRVQSHLAEHAQLAGSLEPGRVQHGPGEGLVMVTRRDLECEGKEPSCFKAELALVVGGVAAAWPSLSAITPAMSDFLMAVSSSTRTPRRDSSERVIFFFSSSPRGNAEYTVTFRTPRARR